MRDLNAYYRRTPALHQLDFDAAGFEWIDFGDAANSVLAFLRKAADPQAPVVLVACNLTPVPRLDYRLGVPRGGRWREVLNSDAAPYGGSGMGNLGAAVATDIAAHGRPHSLSLALPPLGVTFLESDG